MTTSTQRLRQFLRFEATFRPQRTDDLKPGATDWTGHRCVWEALWVIGDDEGAPGLYDGQWACAPVLVGDDPRPPFAWVPDGDLVDREDLP